VIISCSGPDCNRVPKANGLCAAHYGQMRRKGVLAPLRPTRPLGRQLMPTIERIAKWTRPGEGGCWIWNGAIDASGYGRIGIAGKSRMAHRVAYEVYRAEVPTGLTIDHLCGTRSCVNPWHLEPVPIRINTQRRSAAIKRCPQGHEYSESNTYRTPKTGARGCRKCRSAQSIAARRKGSEPS